MIDIDIIHTKGDTFIKHFTFTDNAWDPINLTWSVTKMTIKENVEDSVPLLQKEFDIISAIWWTSKIVFSSAQMTIDTKNYYYDIQFRDSDLNITTLLKWRFILTYEITT